ncbi:MAG: proton-dependent oligopeptide transporter, family [Acidobacteriota bacterium]|jgi:POT family proton-dependent oligopeptide transporter|nr:proton-dependent oligopeptide transporter, family [Acidobacteriota bacterium]
MDETTRLGELENARDTSGLFGHPKGLTTLFFTELWERFSYYGMRAILVLYMVAPPDKGGLGFDTVRATSLYGSYTMFVYLTNLPGGLIADRILGARLAVFLGGIIIACGHFSMVFNSLTFFYTGLTLIAIGTGLLKPNISAMVGSLYGENDPRRESGFSIFYFGINLGAVLAPLACGFLAESQAFKNFLSSMGFNPVSSWHWGFGAAGVGMTIGLIVFLAHRHRLAHVGGTARKRKDAPDFVPNRPLTRDEWKRVGAIFIFFLFTILFWAAYEQKGASLNLFAKTLINRQVGDNEFPASWMQSLTGTFVLILAPLFAILWVRLGKRQPSSPIKFTFGLLFIGLGYLLMVPASMLTAYGKISPLWLVGLYFLEVVGEMFLSPVGLSTVTKLAPVKLLGIMMGVWFLAAALGNKLAGYLGGFFDPNNAGTLMKLYGGIAVGLLISAGILALLTPKIKKLMGKVH